MEYVPLVLVGVVGVVSLGATLAGLVLAKKRGGWQTAMQPTRAGRWPLPRRLVFIGSVAWVAFLLLLLILALIPGGLPQTW